MAASTKATSVDEYHEIAKRVSTAMPECHGCLHKLAEFARMFPPGDPSPKELHEFANNFGESRKLGEEFVSAVTDVTFLGGKPCRNIRKAFFAANLVSTKLVDGISRLLVKSDVNKVPKMGKECDAMEKIVADLEEHLAHLLKLRKLSPEKARDIKFRFMIRLTTHMCGKGKLSFDARDFESFNEIQLACLNELQDTLGDKSKEPEKLKEKWDVKEADSKAETAAEVAVDALRIDDPKRVAFEHGGFKIGCVVVEKKGDQKLPFEIKDIKADGIVNLHQHKLAEEQASLNVAVEVGILVQEWRVVKGGVKQFSIPKNITKSWGFSGCFPHAYAQAKAFAALSEAENKSEKSYRDKLLFCVAPRELRTIAEVSKHELRFNPFTEFSKISPWANNDGPRTKITLAGCDSVRVAPITLPPKMRPSGTRPR